MKRFVKLCAVSVLALALGGTLVTAEAAAKKRKPTLLEQIFGSGDYRGERRSFRRGFDRGDNNFGGIRVIDQRGSGKGKSERRAKALAADQDPEGDSGLGEGNMRYAAPRLVALGGAKLTDPAPGAPEAAAIHGALAGSGPALRVAPEAREAVLAQYAKRGYRPVFVEGTGLSERGKAVLALLATAGEDGLDPEAYLPTGLSSFTAPLPSWDQAAMARLDIDLYGASLAYARDASGGRFDPRKLSRYNDVVPPWVDYKQAANVIAWSPYAIDYLKGLTPTHPAYAAMKAELAKLRAKEAALPEPIADGPIVKRGGSDARIPELRARLVKLGYAGAGAAPDADPAVLDKQLSAELRRFQQDQGIRITGVIGPQTIGALNADRSAREEAMLVTNMERLRWLPRDLGKRYVFVNQPAFEARVMEDGKQVWQTRVIVGKRNTQTAVFHDEMEFVVFNPSWGVPPSIIAKEYLPKLRRDPGYLDRIGFKVVNQKGKVVSSRSVRWSSYGSKVPFGIQQPPGQKNALGEIKFLFPNSHDIYMHDTPSRELFEEDVRAFSHGCVRVQNPREFASVLLGWDAEKVAASIKSPASETVRLPHKIPVHITYFTAWPDANGTMHYFNDIYGRDKAMEDARSAVAVAVVQR